MHISWIAETNVRADSILPVCVQLFSQAMKAYWFLLNTEFNVKLLERQCQVSVSGELRQRMWVCAVCADISLLACHQCPCARTHARTHTRTIQRHCLRCTMRLHACMHETARCSRTNELASMIRPIKSARSLARVHAPCAHTHARAHARTIQPHDALARMRPRE